jgi:hypothetical protein
VRFVDLLRTTVMLSAGAATTLALVTVVSATINSNPTVVFVCAGWWVVSVVVGSRLGRRGEVTQQIGRVLASAKPATMLPEHRPTAVVVNRLWPVLVSTLVAGALGFVAPQIPGIATGFALIWALAWRHQDRAVQAIEERDGVSYYVERTSPVRPIQLVRMPGFRRELQSLNGTNVGQP